MTVRKSKKFGERENKLVSVLKKTHKLDKKRLKKTIKNIKFGRLNIKLI